MEALAAAAHALSDSALLTAPRQANRLLRHRLLPGQNTALACSSAFACSQHVCTAADAVVGCEGESSAAACGDLSEMHCLAQLDGSLQPSCMALATLSQQCGLETAHGCISTAVAAAAAASVTTAISAAQATASAAAASDAAVLAAGADAAHDTSTHAEAAAAAAVKPESWGVPLVLSHDRAVTIHTRDHGYEQLPNSHHHQRDANPIRTPPPPLHILNDILLCTGAAASTAAGSVTALSRLSALSAMCRSEHVRQRRMVEEEEEVVRSAAAAGTRLSSRRRPARFHHHLQETAPELLLHAGLMEALLLRLTVL